MIHGINGSSFIDYPNEISFVIFTGGCNFQCPYCHNGNIVKKQTKIYLVEEIMTMLIKRRRFITAVTITGGEPTIHGEQLIDLIKKIRKLGFNIKLDTNGSNPKVLKKILNLKLIDYIAMDIKNVYEKYNIAAGVKVNLDEIKESIKLIENSKINYEFRTTINKKMHTEDDIISIASSLKNPNNFNLQAYRYSEQQLENIDFGSFTEDEIASIKNKLKV